MIKYFHHDKNGDIDNVIVNFVGHVGDFFFGTVLTGDRSSKCLVIEYEYEVSVFKYTKWWCLSSWWGHHIEIRLKPQAPNYSARHLWRCQIMFLFPPKISPGNYDHVKLFSLFPYFQQLWRDHWCRFSQVLFVQGWTLCYTRKEEPALCVFAYRVKRKHYSSSFIIHLHYIAKSESHLMAEIQSSKPL